MLSSIGEASSKKTPDKVEKDVELIMVDPMPGVVDRRDFGVAEIADAAVLLGIGRPALFTVDQQGRAGDARPQRLGLRLSHAVGSLGADVIIEFPAVGAVLVL